MADKLAGAVFVGRHQEMAELKAALDEALAGQGRLVMLVGEPGIGKTRTAQELAAIAEQRGARVLWGWCYEEEGAPPYWPWVQSLRAYGQQLDPDQLRALMGPGAADIAEIVPEIREKLPGLEPPPALEPEQARFRLFDSITAFVKNAAQAQPLMLVLDDLHWADKSSLLLLPFLARELGGSRLLVVGCYRDVELSRQHPLSEALAQLSRESAGGGFRRVLLRGLSQGDSEPFIQAMAGIQPPQRLVDTIYTNTEGNPFFMKEVVRLLSERGELTAEEVGGPRGIRIPEGVREAIGQRLNRLTEPCNQTLTTASIIGREFEFKVLGRSSSGVSEDQLLLAIDEALAAHLIEEVTGTGERYQFTHALVQQTLAEELSSSRRVRLHARIGEAIEELYGRDADAHAAELAHHFAEARPVVGVEKLVHYSLLAGERALAAYAYEDALAHFERGLAAKGVCLLLT
jgi:predicted ATPase